MKTCLSGEHYKILELLSEEGRILESQLAFSLHYLGGLTLVEACHDLLMELSRHGLVVYDKKGRFSITGRGRQVLVKRKLPCVHRVIHFRHNLARHSHIPHSICVYVRGVHAAYIPRIMVRSWWVGENAISFQPDCQFSRRKGALIVTYGSMMETKVPLGFINQIVEVTA